MAIAKYFFVTHLILILSFTLLFRPTEQNHTHSPSRFQLVTLSHSLGPFRSPKHKAGKFFLPLEVSQIGRLWSFQICSPENFWLFLTRSLSSAFGTDLNSRTTVYNVCFSMTPSPSDADIMSGSCLSQKRISLRHEFEVGDPPELSTMDG